MKMKHVRQNEKYDFFYCFNCGNGESYRRGYHSVDDAPDCDCKGMI